MIIGLGCDAFAKDRQVKALKANGQKKGMKKEWMVS
jgi:hypothetical protein